MEIQNQQFERSQQLNQIQMETQNQKLGHNEQLNQMQMETQNQKLGDNEHLNKIQRKLLRNEQHQNQITTASKFQKMGDVTSPVLVSPPTIVTKEQSALEEIVLLGEGASTAPPTYSTAPLTYSTPPPSIRHRDFMDVDQPHTIGHKPRPASLKFDIESPDKISRNATNPDNLTTGIGMNNPSPTLENKIRYRAPPNFHHASVRSPVWSLFWTRRPFSGWILS